ncbi:MAG: hypothetical protein NPIRA02_14560 [Nitrospirales bacterium]|nr:MAG: hypothetical protein NPIRA02_14560 [Nitrospirales bacterium]
MNKKRQLTTQELESHLREQLQFLESSCNLFDEGIESEAKRLAVTLRILFHDTNSSKSLLGQLNRLRTKFCDTAFDWNPDSILTHGGLVYIASGPPTARYVAMLDDTPNPVKKEVEFENWWNKPVFVDKQRRQLSREKLILTTADQDGGAHVDPTLEESYYALSRENSLNWVANDGYSENAMEGPEKAAIRQIAHETLKTLVPGYEKNL